MFRRQIDPSERQQVLELLGRWSRAIAGIDEATDAVRLTIAEQPMGMQSEEFGEARLAAIAVTEEVRKETEHPRFWPILEDNHGGKIMLEFRMRLEESHRHQFNMLRLWGVAAEAFRSGRDCHAPSEKEMMSIYKSFARGLDDIGRVAGKLARHYRISPQEYQRELQWSGSPTKEDAEDNADLIGGQHMELAPEQRRKIEESREGWKGLTDDELLDEEASWMRPAPGKHLRLPRSLLENMAMEEEMARRGIPRARRVARQEQVIKEMADEIYGPESQEAKDQMIRKMMGTVHRLD